MDAAAIERRRARLPVPRYPDLPVVAHRDVILEAIRDHQVVVVAGETGSGKSTQLPKLCLELGLGVEGLIGHTQPRRLAARAVAERVAEELGSTIGDTVGFTVRFNDQVGPDTFIKVMTDGILLAEIQRDRQLRAYEVLIIDEAHERSLNIDFLLGYLRELLPQRPDLKVIITSATIDTARFSEHFGGAPIVEVTGRSFPVEVRYRPVGEEPGDRRDQTQAIGDAVMELVRQGPGDLLVFLSGEREIRDTADAITRLGLPNTEVLPLYARLSAAEQHRVFAPHPGRRIVLATNVAETSLTVPGIVGVIDPGTARISRFNRRTKVQRLPIEKISQASANQRAGRCGRIAPGTCIRLYAEDDFDARPEFTEPEILRTNLASVILQMAAIGLGDVSGFPFVEPPDQRAIKDGLLLLEELGAIEAGTVGDHVRLTKLGRRLARLPVDPRLGRMILAADREGCVAEVLVLAAALSIQDPRERPSGQEDAARQQHARFADPDSDFIAYLNLWRYLKGQQKVLGSNQFRRTCQREHLHHLRVREWQDVHAQLRTVARDLRLEMKPLADEPDRDAVHRALLSGLLSHIGLLDPEGREYRGARESRFVLAGGTGLGKRRPKWVMAADLVETDRIRARTVAQLQPAWIERAADHLVTRTYEDAWWDEGRGTAMTTERVSLFGLPLVRDRKLQVDRVDPELARRLFIRHALVDGDWTSHHAFVHANKERVADVVDLEARVRRDLLVDDEALFDFFDAKVPADVTTAKRFDGWWKKAVRSTPDLLTYAPADLVDQRGGPVVLDGFPDTWPLGERRLPLHYAMAPGDELDGVTVDVPLAVLDQVESARLDWQVPGRRAELVAALLRGLPKEVRRDAPSLGEWAEALLARVGPDDGPIQVALARVLGVRPVQLDLGDVPGHLLVTYRAIDDRGRALAWSKDLGALRVQLRERIRATVAAASPLAEQTGLRTWPGGDIPRSVSTTHGGHTVTGYPALVDELDDVALRVLASAAEQRTLMWGGTRRLLLLQLGSPLRTLDKALPNAAKLALARSERITASEAYVDAAGAAVDELLVEAGGPVWDEPAWTALLAEVRAQFPRRAASIATGAGEVVAAVASIDDRLSAMLAPAFDDTVVDVQRQLERLLHRGWIATAGARGLPDLLRYVQGIDHRVRKAVEQPARDRARIAGITALETDYRRVASRDLDGSVRTMIEELRLQTFAQPLAKGGVSEQKLKRELLRLGA